MKLSHRWWNSTIRVRLTILYAGTFFLSGLALIAVIYLQLNQVTGQQWASQRFIISNISDSLPSSESAKETTETQIPSASISDLSEPERLIVLKNLPGFGVNLNLARTVEQHFQSARKETLSRMLVVSTVSLFAVGVVAGFLGWLLAGQALHPLRQITATARRVADRNLHERIALEGPEDEIKDLADTLDSMLERLDRAFDSQERFIANASHELRTPLAINRTLIEVALLEEPEPDERLRQLGSTLLAVNRRHEKLMDGLLTLTSSEHRITNPQPVELTEIALHVLGEFSDKAQSLNVEIKSKFELAPTMGDPVLLERLIYNLIDNAGSYNLAQNGWIKITTKTDDQNVSIIVENTGPIVPSYDMPRLFEPFQRLSATARLADNPKSNVSRGAGLGLSIVRSVAVAHDGEIKAAARSEGGLEIIVLFPKAPDDSS